MKLALVTGGTRRLGAAIAARLATAGYDLALHSHRASEPEPDLTKAIRHAGVRWGAFTADLADPQEIDALIPAVAAHFGQAPNVLVNSASRFGGDDWASADMATMLDHYAINAAAPALLARALAAGLGEDEGVVINLLDQRIASPPPDQASYTASKLALAGITQALARALAPRVRVCGVAPGLTLPTPDYSAAQLERLKAMMPLNRLPTPADIAAAVLYLTEAKATTGQVIFVDGGASLRTFDRDFEFLGRD
ncbi:NAD(P)-dependent dehydrogenase (short-subunit alcohol dehydrogenase family) [Sphingomonas vulcanisoli]|uniref:NAD(P)-dependent dehydrogenase (Short-subunit alcohol dehydrogenase family) n=1 Tax=Sphingomonas vulcanisoli TaxID=1658060 RepID=A0ABX0TRD9_9SPHN|nr:SDR family oxidoreductase [Sphingomonas vulcanisoli]NIJ08094.1 NAD(P)-dependent dehydrogenase (short-subunit alcohol dehydrogenase family) [Sphingomonas vulcanisoli]